MKDSESIVSPFDVTRVCHSKGPGLTVTVSMWVFVGLLLP